MLLVLPSDYLGLLSALRDSKGIWPHISALSPALGFYGQKVLVIPVSQK